jgi:hypothetical protein
VVEENPVPFILFVAGLAFGAVAAEVNVLYRVAIDARGADPLVSFADVARGAGNAAVRTLQRELGLVMVEPLDANPCGFAMTVVTCLPKTPFMRINRLVTIEAASRGLAKLDA